MIAGDDGDERACPPSKPRSGSELAKRTGSGLVLAVLALGTLLVGGWPFALVWLAAGIFGFHEWIAMSRAAPARVLVMVGAAVLAAMAVAMRLDLSILSVVVVLALGIAGLFLAARDAISRRNAAIGLVAAAVIVLVPIALRDDPAIGIVGPAWIFAVVWSTDIAAYFTGRTIGGAKLLPSVSPNKTWSGAIGGLVAAMIAGTGLVSLAVSYGAPALAALPLQAVAVASGAASVVSQAGDLFESALKRRYGVKDSGHTIPGHGGIMDRLDGFFAVALLVGAALGVHLVLQR